MNILCSRCKKRMAIVFVSRMDSDQPVNEGYCLQCAKEIGIPHVKEMIDKLGISDDDLDNITGQMSSLLGDEEDFEPGGAMPMPSFLQHFMTSINGESADGEEKGKAPLVPAPEKKNESRGAAKEEAPRKKYKFLDQYCENLTAKAKAGNTINTGWGYYDGEYVNPDTGAKGKWFQLSGGKQVLDENGEASISVEVPANVRRVAFQIYDYLNGNEKLDKDEVELVKVVTQ